MCMGAFATVHVQRTHQTPVHAVGGRLSAGLSYCARPHGEGPVCHPLVLVCCSVTEPAITAAQLPHILKSPLCSALIQ